MGHFAIGKLAVDIWIYSCGFFSVSLVYLLLFQHHAVSVTITLRYVLEIWYRDVSSSGLAVQDCFASQVLLYFHVEFIIIFASSFASSVKNDICILIAIVLNL